MRTLNSCPIKILNSNPNCANLCKLIDSLCVKIPCGLFHFLKVCFVSVSWILIYFLNSQGILKVVISLEKLHKMFLDIKKAVWLILHQLHEKRLIWEVNTRWSYKPELYILRINSKWTTKKLTLDYHELKWVMWISVNFWYLMNIQRH